MPAGRVVALTAATASVLGSFVLVFVPVSVV